MRERRSNSATPWLLRPNSMLSCTVFHGKSANCWNTTARCGPGSVTGLPPTRTAPAVGNARNALQGKHLQELVHGEAAGIARRALGRQDVVGAGGLVAEGDGSFLAEEKRAVVRETREPPVELARMHLEMLGRVAVG